MELDKKVVKIDKDVQSLIRSRLKKTSNSNVNSYLFELPSLFVDKFGISKTLFGINSYFKLTDDFEKNKKSNFSSSSIFRGDEDSFYKNQNTLFSGKLHNTGSAKRLDVLLSRYSFKTINIHSAGTYHGNICSFEVIAKDERHIGILQKAVINTPVKSGWFVSSQRGFTCIFKERDLSILNLEKDSIEKNIDVLGINIYLTFRENNFSRFYLNLPK